MVAYNREIVNTNSSFYDSAMFYLIEVNAISKDINMDKMKGRFFSLSPKSSKELLAHSYLFFVLYIDRIEIQNNNSSWTN